MLGWNEEIKKELGACGQNVMIGHNVMFARPDLVFLGDNVRIDPFALIVCGLVAKGNNQISSHCIMNGREMVYLSEWVGFGYRTTVLTGSEDFTGEFGPANDHFGHNVSNEAPVTFAKYSNALTNSLILPGVVVPEGTVISANSIVSSRDHLEAYWIYGMKQQGKVCDDFSLMMSGVSLKLQKIKERNRENILKFAEEWDNAK